VSRKDRHRFAEKIGNILEAFGRESGEIRAVVVGVEEGEDLKTARHCEES